MSVTFAVVDGKVGLLILTIVNGTKCMWDVEHSGRFSNGKRPCCAEQIPCLGNGVGKRESRVTSTLRAQLRLLDVFYADVEMYTIYPI